MKLPFTLSVRFVFRLLLPGLVFSLAILPLVLRAGAAVGVALDPESALVLLAFALGWLVIVADMPIYMLFEGRRFWPAPLFEIGVGVQRRRLERLDRQIAEAWAEAGKHERAGDGAKREQALQRYREASIKRREYPLVLEDATTLDQAKVGYRAQWPTRLGNVIAAYESYPDRAYGLNASLFWPRLWIKLDKDNREELDNQQAVADSALYVTFALGVSAVLALAYAACVAFGVVFYQSQPSAALFAAAGASSLVLSYALYRLSLHTHGQFGQLFKATFDTFGQELHFAQVDDDIGAVLANAPVGFAERRRRNQALGRYFRNLTGRREDRNKNVPLHLWNNFLDPGAAAADPAAPRVVSSADGGVAACAGDAPPNGHPLVFLAFDERGVARCGYCNRTFEVKVGGEQAGRQY
jgi:uncharacterized Zn-finger protein